MAFYYAKQNGPHTRRFWKLKIHHV